MDEIRITDLEVFANHGVFKEEQKLGQKFVVSAVLYTDTRVAGKSDELSKSIDYGTIAKRITEFLTHNTYLLLETAAEMLAQFLLQHTPNLKRITLEIKKPWAPIGLPLKDVSVRITRGWHETYISFGSNMGNRKGYIRGAITALRTRPDMLVERVSSIRETEPYGMTEQDKFMNGCMRVQTTLTPIELLDVLQSEEEKAGRKRLVHWGPRTLDLDILFYDQMIIGEERLIIPHPEIPYRSFVLEPMAEIAPYKRHPISQKTMKEMLKELQENK